MRPAVRVIIDCDAAFGVPGADTDDCVALALALRSPELHIEAITVVAGNVPVDAAEQAVRQVLHLDGRTDIPVYRGAARPLVETDEIWRAELDGRGARAPATDIWAGIRRAPERGPAEVTPAAAAIVDSVMRAPGEITIVAMGPLTNIALALALEPRLAGSVRGIVAMGGAVHLPGSGNELNFGYDPEAAQMVAASGAPLTLVPLDVTRLTLLTPADNDRLLRSGDPLVEAVAQVTAPWIAWVMRERKQRGCFLHDPLALAVAIQPDLLVTEDLFVAVELGGAHTRGRPVTWRPGAHILKREPPRRAGTVAVATGVDNDRFMALCMQRLMGAGHV